MNNELRFLIYNTPDHDVSVSAIVKDDTVWLTQKAMAELFDCSSDNISLHLKNIFADGELAESATTEEFSVVQKEGSRDVKRATIFYSLDAIISVGYRVHSREKYDEFNKTQKIISDFEKQAKQRLRNGGKDE